MNVNSVNPLHLRINKIKGDFEKVDGDKYLIVISGNGDKMQKYQEVFNVIEEILKKINDYSYPINYDDNYMEIKFNNDNIPLNKIIYLATITVTISIKLLECDRIDIPEGIDINKSSKPKECDFCHYWYLLVKNFN